MTGNTFEKLRFRYATQVTFTFVGLLWFIKALEMATHANYAFLGVLPRTLTGTIGIFTAPLIHGDLLHLISNTIPLILLGILLLYFYSKVALEVFIWIYVVSGFWTWLFARTSYHIGASGVIYGIAAFLFFSGIIRRDRPLMTISAVILFLYGSMLYGIFPKMVEADVSWEAHLAGALAGTILAFLFRKVETGMENSKKTNDENDELADDEYFSKPNSTGDTNTTYTYGAGEDDKP